MCAVQAYHLTLIKTSPKYFAPVRARGALKRGARGMCHFCHIGYSGTAIAAPSYNYLILTEETSTTSHVTTTTCTMAIPSGPADRVSGSRNNWTWTNPREWVSIAWPLGTRYIYYIYIINIITFFASGFSIPSSLSFASCSSFSVEVTIMRQ